MGSKLLLALGFAWLSALAGGVASLWSYATTPGDTEAHPARWPTDSQLARKTDRATLLMFIHPRCPCSRASLTELNLIMTKAGDRAQAFVLFLRPEDAERDWEKSDTWNRAHEIPGVEVIADPGTEAAHFGAVTSGQVLFYEASSELRFSGGITPTRGHEGDSPGRRAVFALLEGETRKSDSTNVYGCPLSDRGAARGTR